MAQSYEVSLVFGLDFVLLGKQIELVQEVRNKSRGERKDMLCGVLDLLISIQEQASEELGNAIVFGQECSKCEDYFHNGVIKDGELLCPKCAGKN